jgi:type I site-specific restriction endonuclease
LLRSHWDLIVVDEAHKMSAYADDRKTLAYRLGESLSSMTDHYLLMTATLHKCNSDVYARRPTVFLLTSSCLRGIR